MALLIFATALPELELGPGATIEVDSLDAGAAVTAMTVYGTYYPPGSGPPASIGPLFVPIPVDDQG